MYLLEEEIFTSATSRSLPHSGRVVSGHADGGPRRPVAPVQVVSSSHVPTEPPPVVAVPQHVLHLSVEEAVGDRYDRALTVVKSSWSNTLKENRTDIKCISELSFYISCACALREFVKKTPDERNLERDTGARPIIMQ